MSQIVIFSHSIQIIVSANLVEYHFIHHIPYSLLFVSHLYHLIYFYLLQNKSVKSSTILPSISTFSSIVAAIFKLPIILDPSIVSSFIYCLTLLCYLNPTDCDICLVDISADIPSVPLINIDIASNNNDNLFADNIAILLFTKIFISIQCL